MSQSPAYDVTVHTTARRELEAVPRHTRDALEACIIAASELRQPSDHAAAQLLRNESGLFRIRQDDYRAICTLDKPELKVLAVDTRSDIYAKTPEARERLEG